MKQRRLYPIGIQTFEDIIRDKYAYVDKTRQVYDLANTGKCFFLSRPRRFGKSLLISTLEAYFRGRKELFKGLAIEKLETKWEQYPVLWLDLNNENYKDAETLESILNRHLYEWEDVYGANPRERTLSDRFVGVIKRAVAQTGKKVVILIDEYDKPLLETIDKSEINEQMRTLLKTFYATLKSQDRNIRFALLTGVSKFSHVTIFSGLNNLVDITMENEFADICGITDQELHDNFDADIQRLADANKMTKEEAYEKLRDNYDGYHFVPDGAGLYNPFSLMNVLRFCNFRDYWFVTETPAFLVKLLRKSKVDLTTLSDGVEASADKLSAIDAHDNHIPMMYQSGYLTIKEYNGRFYRLGFPNGEVHRAFMNCLVPYYLNTADDVGDEKASRLSNAVQGGDVDEMMRLFKEMLGKTPCESNEDAPLELHYRNTICVMVNMTGERVEIEEPTARGRIDVAIESKDYVYVMELKRGTTDEAAEQIEDRRYLDAYAADKRKVIALAVALNDNPQHWQLATGERVMSQIRV